MGGVGGGGGVWVRVRDLGVDAMTAARSLELGVDVGEWWDEEYVMFVLVR